MPHAARNHCLIDKPWLLAAVLAAGAVCGIIVERFVEGQRRSERRAYWQGRNAGDKRGWGNLAQFKAVPPKARPNAPRSMRPSSSGW